MKYWEQAPVMSCVTWLVAMNINAIWWAVALVVSGVTRCKTININDVGKTVYLVVTCALFWASIYICITLQCFDGGLGNSLSLHCCDNKTVFWQTCPSKTHEVVPFLSFEHGSVCQRLSQSHHQCCISGLLEEDVSAEPLAAPDVHLVLYAVSSADGSNYV